MVNIITRRVPLPEELRAVGGYDVDDLLHDFVGVRFASIGIKYETLTVFKIEDNPCYTDEQKVNIRAAFNDPNFYYNMKFYPGIENIMRPAIDFSARIIFPTNCPENKSAMLKRIALHNTIDVPDEDILTITTGFSGQHAMQKKPLPPHMLFYADDAIHNLVNSDAEYLIGMNKPWNADPELRKLLAGRKICWVENENLNLINEIVYSICEEHYRQVTS